MTVVRLKEMMYRLLLISLTASLCAGSASAQIDKQRHAEQMKASSALFSSRVGAALRTHCLKCHGGAKIRGGLSLASRETLLKGGDSGAAIDLRAVDDSLLLTMIEEGDMPPEGDPLPRKLIADIRKWIQLGAAYDRPLVKPSQQPQELQVTEDDRNFWSFRPLSKASPPKLDDPWIRTDIDKFILHRLREKGLQPNSKAAKAVLARRAALDLLGMPPEPKLLASYLEDSSPNAWGKYIDALLASADYGPRWARYWMDVARFAESSGFEHDYDRASAYHYRDFLIQAFNQDLPWTKFVHWQLAGDEVAPEEPLAWMATGFLAAGVFPTQLTENEFESARYDELDDMLNTTGMAFLGLSIGCARCHDHKYDPIPTRDYYELAATFATAIRSERAVEFHKEQFARDLAKWTRRETQLQKALDAYAENELGSEFAEWLTNPQPPKVEDSQWRLLAATTLKAEKASLKQLPDGSVFAAGANAVKEEYLFEARLNGDAKSLRLEVLSDDRLPRKGPGRAGNGNFQLSHISVQALPKADGKQVAIALSNPRATHQQNKSSLSIESSLDGNKGDTGWAVDFGGIGKNNAAVFTFDPPLKRGAQVSIRMRFAGNGRHNLGRFRLSVSAQANAEFEVGKGVNAMLAQTVRKLNEGETLSGEERKLAFDWFASGDKEYQKRQDALASHRAAKPKVNTRKVMICSEGVAPIKHHADGRGYPHFYPQVHYLKGGDAKRKGGEAKQGFLEVLLPGDASIAPWRAAVREGSKSSFRRASLANWLTDAEKGAGRLTARVIVNRLWQHHFGRGIVATPNDFGLQGARPTHPELLDWLANDLINNGWRLKRLHRLIMTSAVYQQSSLADAGRAKSDPDNLLLWRYSPRRLEAEAIRDSLLAVSGLLDRTPYGPGTRDPKMMRRSIYFTIKRSAPPNAMIVFDWPEHLVSIGRRSTTTIAPQSLYLMNSRQVRRYAEGLARRAETLRPESPVDGVYELALGRSPSNSERELALAFLKSQAAAYSEDNKGSALALVDFCQSVFASNEFLYLP